MVESLKELNRICQKPRYKETGNWMVRNFEREAALPLTWLLLHTSITANQVTLISLWVGLLGILLFSFASHGAFLAGTFLLQFWYLLDHVDGQIARYRKTACLTGRFFDFLTHHLIHGVIFFSLGVYCFKKTGHFIFIPWGFLTSIAMTTFNLIHDTKYKTFFEALSKMKRIRIKEESPSPPSCGAKSDPNVLKEGFSFLHKVCEIHVLMNILTVAAIFEAMLKGPLDLRFLLSVIYGIVVPLICVVKAIYVIRYRVVDESFRNTFEEIP